MKDEGKGIRHNDVPHGAGSPRGRAALSEELVHHLPFSVSAVAIGLTLAGIICFLTPTERAGPSSARSKDVIGGRSADSEHAGDDQVGSSEPALPQAGYSDRPDGHAHGNRFRDLFHLFHPLHMLFSAAATTAMFWRYERRVLKAVLIGLVGAIGVCGLSDIVMPHGSLWLLGKSVEWHICVIENPLMVFTFAGVGVVVGLAASRGVHGSTLFSHSLHVFSSTMASIFYLIGPFEHLAWINGVGVVFLFVILAVMIPCCLSDIVFPLLLAGAAHEQYRDETPKRQNVKTPKRSV
jgi:hypothetical protein